MSLTADQITAQNFKSFYDSIRPYLNGQVPTFANAFNRSDLYSTDEKIIGTWIDSKPLYQKTITGTTPSTTSNSWVEISTVDSNMDECVSASLIMHHPTLGHFFANYSTTDLLRKITADGKLAVTITNPEFTSKSYKAVIQYTKVGDTAIKVGTGNDYSTDEQIIGTWIDGKPLYQRTCDMGSLKTVSSTTWYDTGIAYGDADIVVKAWGLSGGGSSSTSNSSCPILAYAESTSPNFVIMVSRDNDSLGIRYFTVQYTKTS